MNPLDGPKAPVRFLDFVIGGRPLYRYLRSHEYFDLVGCIWLEPEWGRRWSANHLLELMLKRRSELPGGQVILYLCPECQEVDCGAITVRIEADDKVFRWTGWAYVDWDGQREEDVGPLRIVEFERSRYEQVLSDTLRLFQEPRPPDPSL